MHAAPDNGQATARAKPVIYNYVGKGADRANDAEVKAVYSKKFRIVDIGERGHTPIKIAEQSLQRLLGQSQQTINGTVLMVCIINSEGRVIEPFVLSSTDKRLNHMALITIAKLRATPATLNGAAISSIQSVELSFTTL